MSESGLHVETAETWQLRGELSFATVSDLLQQIETRLQTQPLPQVLDLQAVTRTDSAGLALLVELLRQARQRNTSLNFHNLPPQLLNIAEVSGLRQLLSA